MPVYNAEIFISASIQSILDQTYRDFEFIIIDDGSTDSSLNIIKSFQALDQRIIVVSRENKGLVNTLNEAIDLARGEWIARMDADDVSHPDRFRLQIAHLQNSKADLCGSWIQYFGNSDNRVWRAYESDLAIKLDMLFKCPMAHPSIMMRTSILKELKYDVSMLFAEDYDLWIRCAQLGLIFTNVQKVLLSYRRHESQISTATYIPQQFYTRKVLESYLKFISRKYEIEELLLQSIFLPFAAKNNFSDNDFELAIEKLYDKSSGEASDAFRNGLLRLCYIFASSNWRLVTKLVSKINDGNNKISLVLWMQLYFIRLTKLNPGSHIFMVLLKFRAYFVKDARL